MLISSFISKKCFLLMEVHSPFPMLLYSMTGNAPL